MVRLLLSRLDRGQSRQLWRGWPGPELGRANHYAPSASLSVPAAHLSLRGDAAPGSDHDAVGGKTVTTLHEVALLRLVAQRLAGEPQPDAAAAVRWLTALQAQDYRGALTSVALRTRNGTSAAVEAALTTGQVVR